MARFKEDKSHNYKPSVKDILAEIEINVCEKEKVPGYTYIKTEKLMSHSGHLYLRNGKYALCLSRDENSRYDHEGYLYGYHRDNMADMKKLMDTFINAEPDDTYGWAPRGRCGHRGRHHRVTKLPTKIFQNELISSSVTNQRCITFLSSSNM